jgi:hypothetical protein
MEAPSMTTTQHYATSEEIGSETRPVSAGRADRNDSQDSHAPAIAVNAAKVLDTTRRAWSEATAPATESAPRRPPRASQSRQRVVPRRSRWPSLVAALNYWSPKPL